jgi:hypothetical protein
MRTLVTHLDRRFLKLLPAVLIITLILSIIGPNIASADPGWYDLNWLHRKKITIDHTKVSATLTDFPVLISLGSDTDLAADAQDDGDDILFTASDETTKLSHEIESFNGTTGKLVAWVKVPTLSSVTNTDIYMYYGNSGATNQQNPTGVWDSNYKMVQHLEETGNPIIDSTGYNNNGTAVNGPTLGATGKIDGAVSFDPTAPPDYINCGNAGSLDVTGKITVEAWIYPTAANLNKGIVAKVQGTSPQYRLLIDNSSGKVKFQVWDTLIGDWITALGGVPSQNNWHHVVGVCNDTNIVIYLDGVATVGDGYSGSIPSTTAYVSIGIHSGIVTANAFQGIIDEARISDTDRSTAWITTSYNNQSNPAAFFSLGPEQNAPTTATVTTNDATSVEEQTATLNGYLNSDGGATCQYAFEWGTSLGSYTANISWTGSINTGASFSYNIPGGLIKGQPYYYRAMVKNIAGVSYGSGVHFLTKPDGPTDLTAIAVSSTKINLSWTKATSAQRTMVRRSTDTFPATISDGTQVYFDTGTSFSDIGLSSGTNYYYCAWSEVTGSQQFSNTFSSTNMTTFSGPPVPGVIGGKVYSVNKAAILAPWIVLGVVAALVLIRIVFYVRKRFKSRPPTEKTQL